MILIFPALACTLLGDVLTTSGYYVYFSSTFNSEMKIPSDSPVRQEHSSLRNVLAIGSNLAFLPAAYNQMEKAWGLPDGKFHFKHDWSGDKLALNDEISHLLIAYKLTQFLQSGYKFLGYSDKKALILGMLESAFIVTAVEYPIDAYNPTQGFGISDLIFDYSGIGLAYLKITDQRFHNWDLKISIKSIGHANRQVLGDETEDYDNYIYWLTYRRLPAVFGLGYSTEHPWPGNVDGQFYLGIGTTVPDLVRPLSKKLAKFLSWSEFYYFNIKWNFLKLD